MVKLTGGVGNGSSGGKFHGGAASNDKHSSVDQVYCTPTLVFCTIERTEYIDVKQLLTCNFRNN